MKVTYDLASQNALSHFITLQHLLPQGHGKAPATTNYWTNLDRNMAKARFPLIYFTMAIASFISLVTGEICVSKNKKKQFGHQISVPGQ